MKHVLIGIAAAALLAGIAGRSVAHQSALPPGNAAAPAWSAYRTPAQLEQLAAPIALYPDPLVGSILAASTYPLEVVEAARWLDDPENAALTGDALAAALEAQPWDRSVKSLVPFAAVVRLMDTDLEWTEQLGDAFLAQPAEVMDAVQRLRQRALAQGTLRSTPQQTVTSDENGITIEPASPDLVYVPYYVPAIYGPWPWADYPPYDFGPPPGVFIGGALIGFGIGIGIFEAPWGWYGPNWRGHGVMIYPHRWRPGRPAGPPDARLPPPRHWEHDPQHREGVPYRNPSTAARYQGAEAGSRHDFRGFPRPAGGRPAQPAPGGSETRHAPTPPAPGAGEMRRAPTRPAPGGPETRHAPTRAAPGAGEIRRAPTPPTPGTGETRRAPTRPAPGGPGIRQAPTPPVQRAQPPAAKPGVPAQHRTPPAFESYGRGAQTRNEGARGSSSRSEPPAPDRRGGSRDPRR